MSYLPTSLDEIQEPKAAPAGTYELQITAAVEHLSGEKSKHPGAPNIRVTLGFVDEPNVPNITHFISLPYGEEDESANFKLLMLKRFLHLFNVPYVPDAEQIRFSMIGATAAVDVGQKLNEETGDVFNTINIPKMRNEPVAGRRGRK